MNFAQLEHNNYYDIVYIVNTHFQEIYNTIYTILCPNSVIIIATISLHTLYYANVVTID